MSVATARVEAVCLSQPGVRVAKRPVDESSSPIAKTKAELTLEEIEPRKLIVSLPHTITEPGSYYIAKDLVGVAGDNGITIAADNVTLDLGGWSLVGVPGSLAGIYAKNQHDIVIRNGTIRLWGGDGIDFTQAGACKLEDLRIRHNDGRGLIVNTDSQVTRCITQSNGAEGIAASNGVQILNNDLFNNVSNGVQVQSGNSAAVVSGNTFRNDNAMLPRSPDDPTLVSRQQDRPIIVNLELDGQVFYRAMVKQSQFDRSRNVRPGLMPS